MVLEHDDKQEMASSVKSRSDSKSSTTPSLKAIRVARFAEATSVNSPTEISYNRPAQLTPLPTPGVFYQPQPQPADIGFEYLSAHRSHGETLGVEMPLSPQSPLKSAMKTPGAGPRTGGENPLSPTFKEEGDLEKRETHTEKEQRRDLRVKVRVRIAKMVLRSTNFACSLIVLGMLGSTFAIFNATRSIPPRNDLPPWAQSTNPWAQIVLLVISCISLTFSLVIFYGYWKGGHKRAERASIWYTVFSIGFFTFSIIMWGIGAGILHSSKSNGNGQDLWGWSCKDNTRKQLFQDQVSYSVVCRMQNWSLVCCLIEIVVETITILIYGITFHRYYTKHKLHKSMELRDKARSELYLAQLRTNTPNTPAPYSARDGYYNPLYSARFVPNIGKDNTHTNIYSTVEDGDGEFVRYISAEPQAPKPFALQAPPAKGTPKPLQLNSFEKTAGPALPPFAGQDVSPIETSSAPSLRADIEPLRAMKVNIPEPGQPQYAPVPVPSAYAVTSPVIPMEQRCDSVPIPGAYSIVSPTSANSGPQYAAIPVPTAYSR